METFIPQEGPGKLWSAGRTCEDGFGLFALGGQVLGEEVKSVGRELLRFQHLRPTRARNVDWTF